MTYCIGAMLDDGMIFASDSRTNAGMDNIAKFCKMAVFERRDGGYLQDNEIGFNASFVVGGQIGGKPIVDRVITRSTLLADAAKCVLVSFDLAMRSNPSVGMPIDLICYERDSLEVRLRRRFDEKDAYFAALGHDWREGTRRVFRDLPGLQW